MLPVAFTGGRENKKRPQTRTLFVFRHQQPREYLRNCNPYCGLLFRTDHISALFPLSHRPQHRPLPQDRLPFIRKKRQRKNLEKFSLQSVSASKRLRSKLHKKRYISIAGCHFSMPAIIALGHPLPQKKNASNGHTISAISAASSKRLD